MASRLSICNLPDGLRQPLYGRFLRRRSCYRLDSDSRNRGTVVEVDVFHGIVHIMVAGAVNVVIFHKEDDRNAGIGENLAVGVVESAARVEDSTHLTRKAQEWSHLRDRRAVRAAPAAQEVGAALPFVPIGH